MNDVTQLDSMPELATVQTLDRDASLLRTDAVYVVFTTMNETLRAVRVAATIANAMTASVMVIHVRAVPYPLSSDEPAAASPVADELVSRARREGIDARVRVYVCRQGERDRVTVTAFKRRSLVVMAGRRSWLPTPAERLRRRLEGLGHFVVFVDRLEQKEALRA
jgi:hypothetical protein